MKTVGGSERRVQYGMSDGSDAELPAWARAAADRVLHDLQQPTPIALRLSRVRDRDVELILAAEENNPVSASGFPLEAYWGSEESGWGIEAFVVRLAYWFSGPNLPGVTRGVGRTAAGVSGASAPSEPRARRPQCMLGVPGGSARDLRDR